MISGGAWGIHILDSMDLEIAALEMALHLVHGSTLSAWCSRSHLRGMIQGDVGSLCHLCDVLLAFPDDACNARMRVQHVDCCVSLEVQHLIKIEPATGTRCKI